MMREVSHVCICTSSALLLDSNQCTFLMTESSKFSNIYSMGKPPDMTKYAMG